MRLAFVLAALALASPALAEDMPPPAQAALIQMVQEAQQREATALVNVYTLRGQLAAEKKRADEAEARLKAAENPVDAGK